MLLQLILSDAREYVWKSGFRKYSPRWFAYFLRNIWFHRAYWALLHYRFGHWAFYQCRTPVIKQIFAVVYVIGIPAVQAWTGSEISYHAKIGKGCLLVHSGLVIGTCSIGDNFVGHAGILVGQNGGEYPTIGSNVQMGAHSIVIGPIKVGNDVKIGAGTTVVKDVEDGHTIVSQAPRILPPKRGASE